MSMKNFITKTVCMKFVHANKNQVKMIIKIIIMNRRIWRFKLTTNMNFINVGKAPVSNPVDKHVELLIMRTGHILRDGRAVAMTYTRGMAISSIKMNLMMMKNTMNPMMTVYGILLANGLRCQHCVSGG